METKQVNEIHKLEFDLSNKMWSCADRISLLEELFGTGEEPPDLSEESARGFLDILQDVEKDLRFMIKNADITPRKKVA